MSFNETQTLNESREKKKKKKKRGEKTLHDESVSKSQPDGAIGADLTAGSDNGRRCVSTISFLLLPFNPLPPPVCRSEPGFFHAHHYRGWRLDGESGLEGKRSTRLEMR